MVRVGVVGLGKMGLSHLAMIRPHPDVDVVAVCDSAAYMLDSLKKYTGLAGYTDYAKMLNAVDLDAVIISTPTRMHADMVRAALDRGLHVFCEKPLSLSPVDSRTLAAIGTDRGLVTQVGYHNRFVASFAEVHSLLGGTAIGQVTHGLAQAYGPVVLRNKGATWRSQRREGGGCLYDYAAHPLDLLTWYFGRPERVNGTVLRSVFSTDTEDEAYSTLTYTDGPSVQLSVNWSDESRRKMTTSIELWGTGGYIQADRQEVRVYLRDTVIPPPGYEVGWNIRYTTDLTAAPWFYLRGEEYSHQLDRFVRCVQGTAPPESSFTDAAVTDEIIAAMLYDAAADSGTAVGATPPAAVPPVPRASATRYREFRDRLLGRLRRR